MSNAARRLERETEVIGRDLRPSSQQTVSRHPIEGVVDLDGRQPLRIEREHLLGGQLLGIEAPLPFDVVVVRRAHQDTRGSGVVVGLVRGDRW